MKNALIVLVIIVLALLGIVYYKSQMSEPAPIVQEPDDTAAIQEDLAEVDLGDLDAEFSGIDSDLNSL